MYLYSILYITQHHWRCHLSVAQFDNDNDDLSFLYVDILQFSSHGKLFLQGKDCLSWCYIFVPLFEDCRFLTGVNVNVNIIVNVESTLLMSILMSMSMLWYNTQSGVFLVTLIACFTCRGLICFTISMTWLVTTITITITWLTKEYEENKYKFDQIIWRKQI